MLRPRDDGRSRKARTSSCRSQDKILGRVACDDVVPSRSPTRSSARPASWSTRSWPSRSRSRRPREASRSAPCSPARPSRGVCAQVLRPQPGQRPHGRHRRGRRRHGRPVHRRAGHPAHPAHLPHRRRGRAHRPPSRSKKAKCGLQGRSFKDVRDGREQPRRAHRGQPLRRARPARRADGITQSLQGALRRTCSGRGRRADQGRHPAVRVGSVQHASSSPSSRHGGVRRRQGRDHVRDEYDDTTGIERLRVIGGQASKELQPHVDIIDADGKTSWRHYPLPTELAPAVQGRRQDLGRATSIVKIARAAARPATSRAACPAWPSCSKPGARRTPRPSSRDRRHRGLRRRGARPAASIVIERRRRHARVPHPARQARHVHAGDRVRSGDKL